MILISIHAPRMGSDQRAAAYNQTVTQFQSTLPGWGATITPATRRTTSTFQSTLPGWGATVQYGYWRRNLKFQSTLPGWGATGGRLFDARTGRISIHAPRMGSDPTTAHGCPRGHDFNPRSPDGERPIVRLPGRLGRHFNPRSPDGERPVGERGHRAEAISIHAPRMGSDEPSRTRSSWPAHFNPRSPDGERPRKWTSSPTIWAKSSIFNTDCIADRR